VQLTTSFHTSLWTLWSGTDSACITRHTPFQIKAHWRQYCL